MNESVYALTSDNITNGEKNKYQNACQHSMTEIMTLLLI